MGFGNRVDRRIERRGLVEDLKVIETIEKGLAPYQVLAIPC